MKILIVGDLHSELHEEAVYQALRRLGHEVLRFSWHEYFRPTQGPFRFADHILKRAQNKYLVGPLVTRVNRDLIRRISDTQPELVFVYRGTHITAQTLREIRRRLPAITLVGYNNDDPFSPMYPKWLWRHFLSCIPEYDLVLAYRHANVEDFRSAGARRVELLRSWYVSERNHQAVLTESDKVRYESDVVFVGHYEDDGRLEALEAVAAAGFRLRIFGPGYDWDPVLRRSGILAGHVPVRLVWGEDYNLALCGGKIALCFLSRLNRDTYTRRCFEIPATKTMMLAEYSPDLAILFSEGHDVELFRSKDELVKKIRFYLQHDDKRLAVASAGYERVVRDGHDVMSRMKAAIEWVRNIQTGKDIPENQSGLGISQGNHAVREEVA